MRAIQIVGPRKIAMLDDAARPEPAEGEVLVRCTHVGLCGSNISQYMGTGLWGDGEFPNPVGWSGTLPSNSISAILRSCVGFPV